MYVEQLAHVLKGLSFLSLTIILQYVFPRDADFC